jgi:2-oxoglutarate ferredoxin oxidoreductase subunit alpha
LNKLYAKYKTIEENETEWEEINTEDADIVFVSFGSTSRNVKTAMKKLREKGHKVGFFRPITLFPFPSQRLAELSKKVKKFVTVEVNMGQMVNDVRLAVNGACPVELINKGVGAPPSADEIISRIEVL